jgi:hypothetical protein
MRLFLASFFAIYSLLHVYVFLKARAAFHFGVKAGVPLALWMALMVAAMVIVRLAERQGHEGFARDFAYVGYAWLGVLFLFVSASLVIDLGRIAAWLAGLVVGRKPLQVSAMAAFLMPLCAAVAISIYGVFEARSIRTERLVVETPKLKGTLKVAQITDVHFGLMQGRWRMERILEVLRAEQPDILVSTGDLVDGQIDGLSRLVPLFREFTPRYGKYAVTGNHEYYAGLRQSLAFTEGSGFNVLRGRAVNVEGLINIAGVDDPTQRSYGGMPYTEAEVLGGLSRERFTLFLKHRPEVDPGSDGLFDLQLSGHVHKGQIFPFTLISSIAYPYQAGFFKFPGGSGLYVSRGTGTWGPPIRFLSPPEVTVIEIKGR